MNRQVCKAAGSKAKDESPTKLTSLRHNTTSKTNMVKTSVKKDQAPLNESENKTSSKKRKLEVNVDVQAPAKRVKKSRTATVSCLRF